MDYLVVTAFLHRILLFDLYRVHLFSAPTYAIRLFARNGWSGIVLIQQSAGTTLDKPIIYFSRLIKSETTTRSGKFQPSYGTQMDFLLGAKHGDYLFRWKGKEKDYQWYFRWNTFQNRISLPQLRVDSPGYRWYAGRLMSSVQPVEIKFSVITAKLEEISIMLPASLVSTGTADVFNGIIIAGPEVRIEPDVQHWTSRYKSSDFQFQLQTQLEGNVIIL